LIDISVIIYITYNIDFDEIENAVIIKIVAKQIHDYINTFPIGKVFLVSDLIVELKKISFVRDVKPVAPVENVKINPNQILRLGNCSISVGDS
jgi:hypothetical protein